MTTTGRIEDRGRQAGAAACPPIVRRLAWAAVVWMAWLGLSGCMIRTPASVDRYQIDGPRADGTVLVDWPARYTQPLVEMADRPKDLRRASDVLTPQRRRERLIGVPGETKPGRTRFHGVYGQGVISELVAEPSAQLRTESDVTYRRSVLAFVTTNLPPETFDSYIRWQDQGVPVEPLGVTYLIIREPAESPSRGVVMHVTSVYPDSPYERAVKLALLRRGWTVIDVDGATGLFRSPRGMFLIDKEKGVEPTARSVARAVDRRLAEWAYAAEAMFEYLDDRGGATPSKPAVLVGCSLGAIAAPTIVARLPDRFEAAVLIGGGANVLKITQRSSLTDAGLELLTTGGSLSSSDRHELFDRYLDASRLDPHHTAAAMGGIPVLVVHAIFDRIVPASTGRALYEQLDRPERWSFPVGHLGLFWLLPSQSARIAEWIGAQVPSDPAADGAEERE